MPLSSGWREVWSCGAVEQVMMVHALSWGNERVAEWRRLNGSRVAYWLDYGIKDVVFGSREGNEK